MHLPLFLAPYFVIPCLLTFIWHRYHLPFMGVSIFITALLLSAYPFLLLRLDDYYNPPVPDESGKCGMPAFSLIFINFILLLPVSLVLQFILDLIFLFLPRQHRLLHKTVLPEKR